jgi:LysM repeat protein
MAGIAGRASLQAAPRRLLASVCVILLTACSHQTSHSTQSSSAAPISSTASTTTTTTTQVSYQVQRGDSLIAIAKRFGVTLDAIIAANNLTNQDQLTEGQVLVIPPAPPIKLDVSPPNAQPGAVFQLTLTGAQSSESVTFEIDSPSGGKFTGPPHTASADGSVTAKYQTTPQGVPGTYTVAATGARGTAVHASFQLDPPQESSK